MKTSVRNFGLAAIAAMAFTCAASAVTILSPSTEAAGNTTTGGTNTQYELGKVNHGQPAGLGLKDADLFEINQLIGMSLNTTATGVSNGATSSDYYRSGNNFSPYAAPSLTGAVSGGPSGGTTDQVFTINGSYVEINVGAGYNYLVAKWNGPNNSAQVWDIAGLTGIIQVPYAYVDSFLNPGENSQNMTAWTLWNPTTVPDGGTTVALLGLALSVIALVPRKLYT